MLLPKWSTIDIYWCGYFPLGRDRWSPLWWLQEAMPEIMDPDGSLPVHESHPHVKQLRARFSLGFRSCAGCQFHLACRSEDQVEGISRIVQLRSSQAVAMEGLPGSETDHVETREAQSYLEDSDVTSSPAGIFHTAPATLPFSSTPRPPIRVEEAQPSREIVQHNLQLPEELLSALLDEPKVPEPLVLQHVWLHLPPVCPHYHRCLLQVDKLGLSLRPLGRSRKATELHPISGLKVLQTESLSFPLSSILDVEEVFELLPPGPMGSVEPPTWKQHFGRKHYIPLGRFIFSRPWKSKQKPCPEYAERLPAAAAYFAVVKVRAGVTGKMPGQDGKMAQSISLKWVYRWGRFLSTTNLFTWLVNSCKASLVWENMFTFCWNSGCSRYKNVSRQTQVSEKKGVCFILEPATHCRALKGANTTLHADAGFPPGS